MIALVLWRPVDAASKKKVWVRVTRTFGVLALAYVIFALQFPDGISQCAILRWSFGGFVVLAGILTMGSTADGISR